MLLNHTASPDDSKKRYRSRDPRELKALTTSPSQSCAAIIPKPRAETYHSLRAISQARNHGGKGFSLKSIGIAGLKLSSANDFARAQRLFDRPYKTWTPETLLELNVNYSRASSRHMYQFYEEQHFFKQSLAEQQLVPHNTLDPCIDYGASGRVYTTTISIQGELDTLATKMILRGSLLRPRFDQPSEFDIMKGLRHNHIVAFVNDFGSPFEDQNEVGVQMYPVAICNLGSYLDDASWLNQVISLHQSQAPRRWKILLKALGCLSSAVRYLHEDCNIKHKDIKPENILINKHGSVLLADFGISKKYENDNFSFGLTMFTDKYAPKEVAKSHGRELDADIYSLGCVYLEIATVACGQTLDEMNLWVFDGHKQHRYRESLRQVKKWIAHLKKMVAFHNPKSTGKNGLDYQQTLTGQHLDMIQSMMSPQRKHRPSIDVVESCFSQFAIECPECKHNDIHKSPRPVSEIRSTGSPHPEALPSLDVLGPSTPGQGMNTRFSNHSTTSRKSIQPTREFYRMFEQAIHLHLDRTFGEGIQSRPWSQHQGRGRQSTPPSGPAPKRQALVNGNHGSHSDGDGNENLNGEKDSNGQGPVSRSSTGTSSSGGFACLYLKHSPHDSHWPGSCRTPFPDFSRVREHLPRVHLVRYSCDRCQTSFNSREELRNHMRLDERCPLRPHADNTSSEQVRVLDQAQFDSLPYRQRSMSDAEKWIRSYRIIFQPSSDTQIPSPYFGDSSYISDRTSVSQSSPLVLSVEDVLNVIQANPHIVASAVASWPGLTTNQSGRTQFNGPSSLSDASQLVPQLAQRGFMGQLPTPQHTTSGMRTNPSIGGDFVDFNAAGNATTNGYPSMAESSNFLGSPDEHQPMVGDQTYMELTADPGYGFDDSLQPAPGASTFEHDSTWSNVEEDRLRDGMYYQGNG